MPRETYRVKTLVELDGPDGTIPAGTEIAGHNAFRLVQIGVAEPVCRLAQERAELDQQRKDQEATLEAERKQDHIERRRQAIAKRRDAERAAFTARLLSGIPVPAEAATDIGPATPEGPGTGEVRKKSKS